jgi:DNA topoisomerase-1
MFNLPREVGKTTDGQTIIADIGRYGPYIKVDKKFVSIKDYNPLRITEKEARERLKEAEAAAKAKNIADFGAIKVLRGPYGPYVTDGKKNARVPKEQDPEKITEAKAKKLLDEAPSNPRRFPKRTPKT